MAKPSFFEEQSDQSRVKALIVSSYFLRWARVMKGVIKQYPQRHPKRCMAYIDLFAGPGKYAEGAMSTPAMVIQEAMKDPEIQEMLVACFNDREPKHVQSLQQTIMALPGIEKFKHSPQFSNQEVAESLVAEFEEMQLVPTLAFVDPFGYKGLSTRLVNAFVEKNFGTDCIFFFNYNRISMGVANDIVRSHMGALFGPERVDEIRTRVDGLDPHEREMTIVEELAQTLKHGGARRYVVPFAFRDERGSRTSHHLILVSKHALANRLIKDVMREQANMRREGIAGFTYNPASKNQAFLAGLDPNQQTIDRLAAELPVRLKGKTLSVVDVFETDNIDRPYALADYKEVLKQLEADGRVSMNPEAASRRKRLGAVTMGDNVMVKFPR